MSAACISNDHEGAVKTAAAIGLESRIAIIGAGPAGLTCAETLRDLGYRRITIFEAGRAAGGKSRSIPYSGAPAEGRGVFEAGTVFFLRSPVYTRLLRRCNLPEECVALPPIQVIDVSSGRIASPLTAFGCPPVGALLSELFRFHRELAALERAHARQPGISPHVTPELCETFATWFKSHGLSNLQIILRPFTAASQLGPEPDSMPAIYGVFLLMLLRRNPFLQQLRARMVQLRVGNGALWQKIAQRHDVRLGEAVIGLHRGENVEITTRRDLHRFDAVIIAIPPRRFLEIADADGEERRVFSQVRSMERMIFTARVEGLPHGVCLAPIYGEGPVPPAHPGLMYEVDRGSGVYNFYPYLDDGATPADAEQAMAKTIERMGGRLKEIINAVHVRDWFPHFPSSALAGGIYHDFDALQGRRRTWFVGELAAGVAVPYVMENAEALCHAAFGKLAQECSP